MKNKLIGVAFGAAIMIAPLAALAATNITNLTLDGFANTTANVGDTVNAKVTYDITANDDVESLSWELVGSGLPKTCVDIPDQINSGTFHPTFDINTTGATAGTFDVRVNLYGVNGAGSEQLCQANHQVDTMTFADRIAITEDNNTTGVGTGTGNTGGSGSSNSAPSWFQAWLNAWNAAHQTPSTPPTTSNVAKCALIAPYLGATPYAYTALGTQLQSALLLDNPHSIPALDNSLHPTGTVPMGYFGVQTHAALAAYVAMYHCN